MLNGHMGDVLLHTYMRIVVSHHTIDQGLVSFNAQGMTTNYTLIDKLSRMVLMIYTKSSNLTHVSYVSCITASLSAGVAAIYYMY